MEDGVKVDLPSALKNLRKELDLQVNFLRMVRLEKGGRELALVITKLQEARLWAGDTMKEMGLFDKKKKA